MASMDIDGVLLPKLVGAVEAEDSVGGDEAEDRDGCLEWSESQPFGSEEGWVGGGSGSGSRLLSMGQDI